MDTTMSITNLALGGAVGAAAKLIMLFDVTGQRASALTLLTAFLLTLLYAYTHETHYERIMLWTYFVMFLDITVASIAGFHVTEEGVKAAQRNNLL